MMLRPLAAFTLALGTCALRAQTPSRPAPSAPAPTTPVPTAPVPAAPAAPPAADALPDAPSTTTQVRPPAVPTGPTVLIDTSMGRLTCKTFDRQAPLTVANFIGLADGSKDWIDPRTEQKMHNKRLFDATTFHRVIPGFMIQGGDPTGTGTGDPGYFFQDEIDPALAFDVPGRLAMANSGPGPAGTGTNGSQFFVTEVEVPQLNGRHTIFGQCDAHSVLIVSSIARVERDATDKPRTPVTINKVTIVREGEPMPPDPAAAPAAATPATSTPPVPANSPMTGPATTIKVEPGGSTVGPPR